MDLPAPECRLGYTHAQIVEIMGDRLDAFQNFQSGATCSICNGQVYNHETREYEADTVCKHPHGVVTYRCDVEQFLAGRPPLD